MSRERQTEGRRKQTEVHQCQQVDPTARNNLTIAKKTYATTLY